MSAPADPVRQVRTRMLQRAINRRAAALANEAFKPIQAWLTEHMVEKFPDDGSFMPGAEFYELDSLTLDDWLASQVDDDDPPSDEDGEDDDLHDVEPF